MPGFSDKNIKPYRRPTAKALHESRIASIRQATSAASEAAIAAAEKEKVTFTGSLLSASIAGLNIFAKQKQPYIRSMLCHDKPPP